MNNKNIRALRICHAFPFFSIRFYGGTSDWMYKLCKAQASTDLLPEILTGQFRYDDELAQTATNVRFTVIRSYFNKAGLSIMPGLFTFLRNNMLNYDVVHMHAFRSFQNIVLYFYCRKFGVPYIIDAHGAVPYHQRKPIIKRLFDWMVGQSILRNASLIIAETDVGVREYLAILPSLDRDKIIVLPAPFDTDEFLSLPEYGAFRSKFGVSQTERLIMFLGRVHEIKGNDFLLLGFAELLKRRQDIKLAIVGSDDGHLEYCKSEADRLGIRDKVVFTGFLGGQEKLSALVDADIVAQMSRAEQGAWAPIEAVLAGTPIIVSHHTGAGEDIRRLNAGYTAMFGDTKNLADQLDWILLHYGSALRLTENARTLIIGTHSLKVRINEFKEIYWRCVKKRSHIAVRNEARKDA